MAEEKSAACKTHLMFCVTPVCLSRCPIDGIVTRLWARHTKNRGSIHGRGKKCSLLGSLESGCAHPLPPPQPLI